MEYEDKKMLYEGHLVGGLIQGQGKMAFSNGMYYQGEWADNLFSGEGSLHLVDHRVVKGTWTECSLLEGDIIDLEVQGSESSFTSKSLEDTRTFVKLKLKPYLALLLNKVQVKA